MRAELDDAVVLALVSSFEAAIFEDANVRRDAGAKDGVSVRLRTLLDQGEPGVAAVLDVWKEASGASQAVGNYKQVVNYRHFLAHGGRLPGRQQFGPDEVVERARALQAAVTGFPRLVDW